MESWSIDIRKEYFKFSAAHFLIFPDGTAERLHGHNYRVEVTVQGKVDERTGLMVDLRHLDQIVQEEVIRRYDHRNLNMDAVEFRELNPTSENLAKVIWRRLERRLIGTSLYKVAVLETDRNCFAYYGEGE